jgi:hypothetical protein
MDRHPLDQFFKKKLEGRELPFEEAYWARAQREIVRRQWRKRLVWWGGAVLALFLVLALGWWGMAENEKTMLSRDTVYPGTEQSEEWTNGPLTDEETSKHSTEENTILTSSDPEVNQTNVISSMNSRKEVKQSKAESDFKTGNEKERAIISPTRQSGLEVDELIERRQSGPLEAKTTALSGGSGKDEGKSAVNLEADESEQFVLDRDEEETKGDFEEESTNGAGERGEGEKTDREGVPGEEAPEWTDALPLLSSGEALVSSLFSPEPYESEVKGFILKRKPPQKLDFGLTASLSLAGSLRETDNLAAGLTIAWPLSSRLRLVAEPSWYSWTAGFEYRQQAPEVTYGFGLQKRIYALEVQRLHYAGLPLYLQYGYGKISLEGGFTSKYLLAARALYEYKDDPEQGAQVFDQQKGRLGRGNFNRLRLGAFAGLRYHLISRFSLGIRASFDPQPVMSDTGAELPGAFIEQGAGDWFWSVHVFYRINGKR